MIFNKTECGGLKSPRFLCFPGARWNTLVAGGSEFRDPMESGGEAPEEDVLDAMPGCSQAFHPNFSNCGGMTFFSLRFFFLLKFTDNKGVKLLISPLSLSLARSLACGSNAITQTQTKLLEAPWKTLTVRCPQCGPTCITYKKRRGTLS